MSLINKMLLDLDQRVDAGPMKSTAARVLAGLRPAVKDEPAAPLRRRYELVALLLAVLLAIGAYTWQRMAYPVASLEKTADSVSTPALDDPFSNSSEQPVIHLPALPEIVAAGEKVERSLPLGAVGGLVVEPEPPEAEELAQIDDEERALKSVGRVQFPLTVLEPIPDALPVKAPDNPAAKRATVPEKLVAPVQRERVAVTPAVAVPAIRAVSAIAAVPVVHSAAVVPVVATPQTTPPVIAQQNLSTVPALIEVSPIAKGSVAPPLGHSVVLEKRAVGFNVDLAEDMHRDAITLTEQGRLAEAYDKFRDALAHDPRHVKAREGLVNVLLQQGHAAEAQDVLYEGINAVPGNVAFGQQLARLYAEQGKNEKALTLLESNRELAKGNADYLGFLAAIYQRVGQPAQAQEAYKQALALRPLDGRWWTGLAIAYEAENKWSAAREAYAHVRASLNVDEKLSDYAEKRMAVLASRP